MVGLNIDRLQDGEKISTLQPWHIFQLADSQYGNSSDRPIEFFQPQMHAQDLLAIIDKFYQLADDFSMIPRYMAGSDKVAGAGRTASGLSMLMDAANKGLKAAVANIDAALSVLLGKLYNHNMIFDPDETIKGDAQVVARGATSLMQLESLRLRRNEFLMATNNPTDTQIIGLGGRAEILRATAKDLEMDTTRIVPPREKFAEQAAQPGMAPGQPGQSQGQGQPGPHMSQEVLGNGAPVADNFSPSSMTQGYAEGGLVEDRGSLVQSPLQAFQSNVESFAAEQNWRQGHQLTNMQKERIVEDRAGLIAQGQALGVMAPSSMTRPQTTEAATAAPAPALEDQPYQMQPLQRKPKQSVLGSSSLGSGLGLL
jgi:hypothetical protein